MKSFENTPFVGQRQTGLKTISEQPYAYLQYRRISSCTVSDKPS